ncbi:MAG: PHP domain-containing protein [Ruminococcaceae bacterium]|nr:PHP domain-containing protein [Oscillospiraceae bacterium]
MKYYYDLHLHSCLSPCGDMDMTPNNIVGMSKLLGLNIIALTDHNSSLNCEAVMKLGEENGLCVIPGMELTTMDEIHVVCLFPTLKKALEFNDYVKEHQMQLQNRADIYGRQVVMDENDNEIDEESNLLILATDISISNINELVSSFGGVCYPAHINRDSMSVLAVLGEIPPECDFTTVEVSSSGDIEKLKAMHPVLNDMLIVKNSDAHYLENMKDAQNYFELEKLSVESVLEVLKNKK